MRDRSLELMMESMRPSASGFTPLIVGSPAIPMSKTEYYETIISARDKGQNVMFGNGTGSQRRVQFNHDRSLDGPTSMPTWIDVAGFYVGLIVVLALFVAAASA